MTINGGSVLNPCKVRKVNYKLFVFEFEASEIRNADGQESEREGIDY